MSSKRGDSKAGKSSINYHQLPLDEHQLFEPAAFLSKDRNANHQSKPSAQSGDRTIDRRLTTPQLVSALTGIWSLVGHPESSDTAQRSENHGISHKEETMCFSREQKGHTLASYCTENSGLSSSSCLSTPKSIYEDLSSVKKTLMLTSCSSMIGASSTWRYVHATNTLGITHYLQHRNIYPIQTSSGNMDLEDRCFGRDDNYFGQIENMPTELCDNSSEVTSITHVCESSLHGTQSNLEISEECSISPACSFQQTANGKESRIMPGNQTKEPTCASCLVGNAAAVNSANIDESVYGLVSQQLSVDKCSPEFESSFQRRFYGAVPVNKHALAGALAGTVVSVSLHPVDTVKTIIQANSSGQSSFYHTLRRTLVERGVSGLYGGLSSKVACSAPISAIYTLTYEIIKGTLLPVLPKEYHSIAHCAAGGCSSIATSFVYTPSECIKQQMQVGSQYQNCWNALLGCVRRGGIASLYTGWGAVLCRNIPHSIVKFYAYESLKQFMLKSAPANANLDSGQTLLCGGFAGSTAALFTTPFDVVKTRVQLQALSPVSKYEGVLHALTEIFQREGLRGLYRGLTPRLAIYISQGAIFFTSYEFVKTVMFPEQELPATSF